MTNDVELAIAAAALRGHLPSGTLSERVSAAFRYCIEHRSSVFWMSARVDDDLMFKTGLAAVLLDSDEADRDIITRSMRPLHALASAMSGVPVDFSAITLDEDILPLMKLFHAAKEKP